MPTNTASGMVNLYFQWPDGTYTKVEVKEVNLDNETSELVPSGIWRNAGLSFHLRIRKYSKKTFKKFLMSRGFQRDTAENICKVVRAAGNSYSEAYVNYIFTLIEEGEEHADRYC